MYLFHLRVPQLVQLRKIVRLLFLFFLLLPFAAGDGGELFFLLRRLTSAEDIVHILALIEQPRLTL